MSINLSVPKETDLPDLKPRITVIGVGGAGGNAVNNMIQLALEGVDFVAANTDAQALALSRADHRIQLGVTVTRGLGAGARADVGRAAAEESINEVIERLKGSNMAFIAAGMGGGTGTGAAPVIARAAREQGILTVGVVTKPFDFEGRHRLRIAEAGIEELEQYVDTLIIIPNQNLFRVANEKTTFADAFAMADNVLYSGVRGVTDLMVMPGLINLDFADVRSVMSEMGKAMMGTGEAEGERRALDAAEAAISNPLLDDTSMHGAKGVLINITGGIDMTLFEVDEAANRIRSEVDEDAYIIFGSTFDKNLDGRVRVSVVATGIEAAAGMAAKPMVVPLAGHRPVPVRVREPEPVPAAPAPAPVADAPAAALAVAPAAAEIVPAAVATANPEPAPAPTPAPQTGGVFEHFIPPAPMTRGGDEPRRHARPIEAADLANGASRNPPSRGDVAPKPAEPVRRPSLFERVTGIGSPKAGRVFDGRPAVPAAPAHAPVPAPQPAAERPVPIRDRTLLGSLNPAERVAESQPDDDLLDIPAFLRRQAN